MLPQIASSEPAGSSNGPTSAPVALINETMARRFWPSEDPLGKSFSTKPLGSVSISPWWPEQVSDTFTIVGVVGDVKESRLNDQAEAVMSWSYLQNATRYAHVLVRTQVDTDERYQPGSGGDSRR